jgi:NAD(P)H-hydrate epimerase
VRAYDRRAIAAGVPGIVLMENAARNATDLLVSLGIAGPIAILAGKGNNAGDGFVMARHLNAMGYDVRVELAGDPAELTGDAKIAFAGLSVVDVPIERTDPADRAGLLGRMRRCEWLVDALLGTGAQGPARPPIAGVIETALNAQRRIFAVDLPSGLDADTGLPMGPTIRAAVTATFVGRKRGFDEPRSVEFTGPVHVIEIGAGDDGLR